MASHTIFDLNDGNKMPRLGFGLWQVPDEQAPDIVHQAIRTGYRLIDTAAGYGNEEGVGEGISAAGVARTDLFVTTKLASQDHGYDEALKAFDKSLERLGLAYVDLYLIHGLALGKTVTSRPGRPSSGSNRKVVAVHRGL